MVKNKHHLEVLKELKKNLKKTTKVNRDFEKRYVGTDKFCYSIRTADKEKALKAFLKSHKGISPKELALLLNSLFLGKSFEEVTVAGKLLEFLPKFKESFDIRFLDNWLNYTIGWAEVDSLCQANFGSDFILDRWFEWEKLLEKFSNDKNVHKRRASLVLLTKACQQSDDPRLIKIAFANIEKLKTEKDILITKAISWLLRSLVRNNKSLVNDYLKENKNSLPKIVVRETENKIKTGKKSKKELSSFYDKFYCLR